MFKYRKRSPIGGLAANLTAHFDESESARAYSTRIHGNISMSPPADGLYWRDFFWMAFGLSLHGPALASHFPGGAVFQVVDFTFPLADYRPEVAALAVDGWLEQELGMPSSGATVSFDPERSEYVFHWGDTQTPQGPF